ncbi:MAG: sulfatase-like hydrolase/transferase [Saccharothrix sp.]|nr:sulfatase-like hydrolase/transferase [Saccharothrix sp.]
MTHKDNADQTGITRRAFFGTSAAVGAGLALPTPPAVADADSDERPFRARVGEDGGSRPNLLVILADDLGWADLSSYGAPHITTPNLDRLAREGVRFTDAYSGSAVCSPTRFSLYTGRYPGRTPGGLAEPINNRDVGLDPAHPTLASLLKGAGYATALIGKWHCGHLPAYGPTKSGWDEFFGNFGGALEYFSKLDNAAQYDLYEGDVAYQDLRYYTTVVAERAVAHLRRTQHRPWLLNLNFTTPHWPWLTEDDAEEGARLAAKLRAGGDQGRGGALFHADGGSVETYARMVESLDAAIGDVLDALRATGQEDNTLVLFSSDNGGERFSYQWPLSGAKGSLNEGGIRVPTIVRWPDRLDGGQVSHEPVFTPDWTATLLDLARTAPAATHPLDGTSLAGYLLRGDDLPERDLFWRVRRNRALRRGDWKYFRDGNGVDHLYNLAEDVREQADLAREQAALLAELRSAWEVVDATLLPYPAA